jgi:hypothetical protein
MARKSSKDPNQLGLLEARVSTAPCVAGIRQKVMAWRNGGYQGVTDTTRLLMNHWFRTDHRLRTGQRFVYHYFQREAVETLVTFSRSRRSGGIRHWSKPLRPEAICASCSMTILLATA